MGKMLLPLSDYSLALPPGSKFRLRIEKELFQLKQWCRIGMRPWRGLWFIRAASQQGSSKPQRQWYHS